MTPSEQLTFDLCARSFLSLWSYANPQRPGGKELCDVLAVFGRHIVVFSVKEIALPATELNDVLAKRWVRKAVDESVKQLHGALRLMPTMSHVIRSDGTPGIYLPANSDRLVHLVAVAAGGRREVPFAGGEKDGHYVHVLDEFALREIVRELNTASDFLDYLVAKESFPGMIVCEGEENLLGFYLHRGRNLPNDMHMITLDDTVWPGVRSKPEFLARLAEDRVSYWWDDLIERLIEAHDVSNESGPTLSEHELVVRTLAAESRFARRMLSASMLNWLKRRQVGARTLVSPSGVGYIFATYPDDWSREYRTCELQARCIVCRSPTVTGCRTLIGLGTELYDPAGSSFDAVYFNQPEWTPDDEQLALETREKFGLLEEPIYSRARADEFPNTERSLRNKRKRDRRMRKHGNA